MSFHSLFVVSLLALANAQTTPAPSAPTTSLEPLASRTFAYSDLPYQVSGNNAGPRGPQLGYSSGSTDQAMDRNTIVFQIELSCERNPNAPKGSTKDHELYINHELLSSHLVWTPAGEQQEVFAGNPPAPTNPNIVLAKMRPGQAVHMELHAVKGVGKIILNTLLLVRLIAFFSPIQIY